GWVFEVPVTTKPALSKPKPIVRMGRFMHEACCTDPRSGIVYMTEDRADGALYRYVPENPDDLHAGGRLETLAIVDQPKLEMRNWASTDIHPGDRFAVRWITMDDVHSPDDDLRYRAFELGAARFSRGEGMWWGNNSAYFACTT